MTFEIFLFMDNFLISKNYIQISMYFQLQKMYSCETLCKGACITRIVEVRNYNTNTIMEKKTKQRGEAGLRIWNFQGYWRNSKWIFQGVN